MVIPMNPAWSKLKPVEELKTGLFPCNRWGMVYNRRMGGWRCLACQNDFHRAVSARDHYCPWEGRWRLWSKREAPVMPQAIKEVLIGEKPTKGLVDRLFSFLRG